MIIEQTTPPDEADVLNLVSVADVKAQENIVHSAHDARITQNIKSAYAFLDGKDGWLNRSILTQEWKLWLPSFSNRTELRLGPVQSVDAFEYIDTDGDPQTVDVDTYEVITESYVPYVCKISGQSWPTTISREKAVSITYTAGFGDADTIPFPQVQKLKQAILFLAVHLYRHPSPTYAEPRNINVNRNVNFTLDHLIGFLRMPPDYS